MEPDTDLHRHPLGALYLITVARHGLLHAQCRIAGAHGMVFMGNGGAEEGHNSIPHHLVDDTLVAVHGLDHALQHWVQELAGLLGVALGQQLHGPLQVRKQHGNLLAFAFEGAAGEENLLGEVHRGGGQGHTYRLAERCWGRRGSGGWG
jgi:hypothetical protein